MIVFAKYYAAKIVSTSRRCLGLTTHRLVMDGTPKRVGDGPAGTFDLEYAELGMKKLKATSHYGKQGL